MMKILWLLGVTQCSAFLYRSLYVNHLSLATFSNPVPPCINQTKVNREMRFLLSSNICEIKIYVSVISNDLQTIIALHAD